MVFFSFDHLRTRGGAESRDILTVVGFGVVSTLYYFFLSRRPQFFEIAEQYPRSPAHFLFIFTIHYYFHSVDDSFLQRAASAIPKHAIFLIEDIDCAFASRDGDSDNPNSDSYSDYDGMDMRAAMMMGMYPGGVKPEGRGARSLVTLSGLLNVIDGIGSEEGKLFFATVCRYYLRVFFFLVCLFASCSLPSFIFPFISYPYFCSFSGAHMD